MEETKLREVLETPIVVYYSAGLISARAFNICEDNGIITLRDLWNYHKVGELSRLRNCGRKTVDELGKLIDSFVDSNSNEFDGNLEQEIVTSVQMRTPIRMYYDQGKISRPAFNFCLKNDISTVGDLLCFRSDVGFEGKAGCGHKSIKEFEKIIETFLNDNTNELAQYYNLPCVVRTIVERWYYKRLVDFSEKCINQFYTLFANPISFYCFFWCNQTELAKRFNSVQGLELKLYCYQMLSGIYSSIREEQYTLSTTYELLVIARAIIWFCDEKYVEELESMVSDLKVKRNVLMSDFAEKCGELSSRAIKVQKSQIPNYLQALVLFKMDEMQLNCYLFPKQEKRTTLTELIYFINSLKKTLFKYESYDLNEISKERIIKIFPFLPEEYIGFVSDYYNQYGHYPMFFLLRFYFLKTEKKQEKVFAMATGLYDGHCWSMADIGRFYDHSGEYIRSLLKESTIDIFKNREWSRYKLNSVSVITKDDSFYIDAVCNEKVDFSFEMFARICSLGFSMTMINVNNVIFLVTTSVSAKIIQGVCRMVKKAIATLRTEPVHLQINDFLYDVANDNKDEYKKVISFIIKKAYGLAVSNEGIVVLPQNKIDIISEICGILRGKGCPMSILELFYELQQKFPEIKYNEAKQLKPILMRAAEIMPIGLTSKYALVEWNNVYFGSIRDLVTQLLMDSDKPMHIDDLMPKILRIYPNTNKRSVSSSVRDSERFVAFGHGYFGLADKNYRDYEIKQIQIRVLDRPRPKKETRPKETKEIKRFYKVKEAVDETLEDKLKVTETKKGERSETQIEFQRKCRQFLDFALNRGVPNIKTNPFLYKWLKETLGNLNNLDESRRVYFEGMLNVLRRRGFDI